MAFATAQNRPVARDWPVRFAHWHPVAVVIAALLAALVAPLVWRVPAPELLVAATVLVLLGVPHGAVDHRVARPFLRTRFGPSWFLWFTAGYLAVAAVILALWFAAPDGALVLFLLVAAFHFGTEDAFGQGPIARTARGAMPIALPILLHAELTEGFFRALGADVEVVPALFAVVLLWIPIGALHVVALLRARSYLDLAEIGAIGLAFAALPPLAGFAFYFLVVHSPRHMALLAARHDARNAAAGWSWAFRNSAMLTVAAFLIGALLFQVHDGTYGERLVRAVFWLVAALTVPHVIVDLVDRHFGGGRLR
jgi:Brp/Blh family beta-carotene 15,15'-monooxygenase